MNPHKMVLAAAVFSLLASHAFAFDPLFDVRVDYDVGIGPYTVCAADFDGDGDIDLAVANTGEPYWNGSVSILKNNGDGTFAAAVNYGAGVCSRYLCAADLDGDGDSDLAVANCSNDVSILKNNGDGTFAAPVNYGVGNYPVSVCAADLDGDGDSDLAVANAGFNNVSILKNNGDGTFTAAGNHGVGINPESLCTADLDGDGDSDLVTANYSYSNDVSILKNNGDGTFAYAVNYDMGCCPLFVCAADFDGDGDIDLAVTNPGVAGVSILKNNGDGTFAAAVNYGAGDFPYYVCTADLDGDGASDLAVANPDSSSVSILKNNGDGTFAAPVNYGVGNYPEGVCAADLDGDGASDLAVANLYSNTVSILINTTNGSLPHFPFACSFNEVFSYQWGKGTKTFNAWQSIGAPDGKGTPLGYGGRLVLRFANDIINRPGPDIRVYELGHSYPPAIDENYRVEASLDGLSWASLGEAPGDIADFDLATGDLAAARFVRITDLPPNESLAIPNYDPTVMGADIDAVVALNCANMETDCSDGIDNDGDGLADCQDPDCHIDADQDGYYAPPCGNDCDDSNGNVNPGTTETCHNNRDDDCDGFADCCDADCYGPGAADSDHDGIADCSDPCPYPNTLCQWFVYDPDEAQEPRPHYNIDIAVAYDEDMDDGGDWTTGLQADIAKLHDGLSSIPSLADVMPRYQTLALRTTGARRSATRDQVQDV